MHVYLEALRVMEIKNENFDSVWGRGFMRFISKNLLSVIML